MKFLRLNIPFFTWLSNQEKYNWILEAHELSLERSKAQELFLEKPAQPMREEPIETNTLENWINILETHHKSEEIENDLSSVDIKEVRSEELEETKNDLSSVGIEEVESSPRSTTT